MKYSLLVVDDEKIIREGVGKYVEKHCDRVSVDGLFADGAEVIEYLESHDADIIISDIKMAGMTGLELAKYVSSTKPHIKMIILSGYKKFEYAKEAMSYNVEEYLLKPVSNAEIKNAVNTAVDKLDNEKMLAGKLEQYDEIIGDMRSRFFVNLTVGSFGKDVDIRSEFDKLGFDFEYENINAYVCSLEFDSEFYDNWTYGKDGADTAIMNFLNQCEYISYFSKIDDGLYVILSNRKNFSDIQNQISEYIGETLETEIEFHCHYNTCGIEKLREYSIMNVKNFDDIDDGVKLQIFKLMNSYLNLGMIENARELFLHLSGELPEDKIRELLEFLYTNTCLDENTQGVLPDNLTMEDTFEYLCEHVQKAGENEDSLIQKIKEAKADV